MAIPVGGELRIDDVVAVAGGARVELAAGALERMRAARALVEDRVRAGDTVYGVTTGIGSLATVRISPDQSAKLQEDIVRSHATAVGPSLSREESRAMLALRAHVLALGYSGVRPEIVDLMIEMLNRGVTPVVPERGSLGASGDLAPLAHLALPVIGGGRATFEGVERDGAEALRAAGLRTVALQAKEGLALVNGTQGMLAIGILSAVRARRLAKAADIAAAMSVEAALGTDRAFDPRLHALRPHPGQAASASNIRALLRESPILASHRESGHLVQDAYSLRCAPQVHGAFRDVLAFTTEVLEREASSVSDNPVVFAGDGDVVSGGNFHGAPLAAALDALAAPAVSLASISERRLYRLLDPTLNNGLPPFLVSNVGLNSGLMLVQYTAASIVSESKWLAHPAAVDSITSSAGQEDHVSMGMTSARHLRECVANAEVVVALELLTAAQALDLRAPLAPAAGTDAARRALRSAIPHLDADRELAPDIAAAVDLVRTSFVKQVEDTVGPLD